MDGLVDIEAIRQDLAQRSNLTYDNSIADDDDYSQHQLDSNNENNLHPPVKRQFEDSKLRTPLESNEQQTGLFDEKQDIHHVFGNVEKFFAISSLTYNRNKSWMERMAHQAESLIDCERLLDEARQREKSSFVLIESLKRERIAAEQQLFEIKSQMLSAKTELIEERDMLKDKVIEMDKYEKKALSEVELCKSQIRQLKEENSELGRQLTLNNTKTYEDLHSHLRSFENENLTLRKQILELTAENNRLKNENSSTKSNNNKNNIIIDNNDHNAGHVAKLTETVQLKDKKLADLTAEKQRLHKHCQQLLNLVDQYQKQNSSTKTNQGTNSLRGPNLYGPATLMENWQDVRQESNVAHIIQAEVVRQKKQRRQNYQPRYTLNPTEVDELSIAQQKLRNYEDTNRTDLKTITQRADVASVSPSMELREINKKCGHFYPSKWESTYQLSFGNDISKKFDPLAGNWTGSVFAPYKINPADKWRTTHTVSYRASVLNPFGNQERVFLPDESDPYRPLTEHKSLCATWNSDTTQTVKNEHEMMGMQSMDSEHSLSLSDFLEYEIKDDSDVNDIQTNEQSDNEITTGRNNNYYRSYTGKLNKEQENDDFKVTTVCEKKPPFEFHHENVPDAEIKMAQKRILTTKTNKIVDPLPISPSYAGYIAYRSR